MSFDFVYSDFYVVFRQPSNVSDNKVHSSNEKKEEMFLVEDPFIICSLSLSITLEDA